jgi:hypothetical protein
MRTTLTIDDDLAAILERERRTKGLSLKEMVNSTLRRGLASEHALPSRPVVVTRPHPFGFKAGIDLDKLNQMADELEAEATVDTLKR